MLERYLMTSLVSLVLWSTVLGGEGEKKRTDLEGTTSLELRVLQLEDEIAELKETIQLLREHLLGPARPDPSGEQPPLAESGLAASSGIAADADRTTPSHQETAPDPGTLRVYWNEGLRLDSADRKVRLRLGGRIQNDWNFHYEDDLTGSPPGSDGVEFRRSRLYFSGEMGRVSFKAEYDFAEGEAGFTDVYVGVGDLPVLGTLKIGHFKEPFGMEELTSSLSTTFLERSLGTLAFAPARNTGLMFSNTVLEDRLLWSAGFFKESNGIGLAVGNGSYSFTGRLAGTPWKRSSSRLLHLGVAYSHRDSVLEMSRFTSRPEAHLAPPLVNTGDFASDSSDLVGLEGALVYDRFAIQTEFIKALVDGPQADPSFSSFYTEGSLFLTRDSRQYSSSSAVFDRVRPGRAFLDGEGGMGAWELVARYSQINLDDGFVLGGKQKDFTLGLNWYLNPTSRFMFNFVHANPERDGTLKVLQARFQVDF